MTVREVLTYPHRSLKTVAEPCGRIDSEVVSLAQDLLDTMLAHSGCVGLSAPQIGVSRRVIVVDVTGHPKASAQHGPLAIVDPVITRQEGHELGREGCLSLPQITANVGRATSIEVAGVSLEGETVCVRTAAFEARAILHEVDHLDGILILDRAASPSEVFPRREARR
ncbi:MAG: peptide deformylase [Actinomycetota bacterium]